MERGVPAPWEHGPHPFFPHIALRQRKTQRDGERGRLLCPRVSKYLGVDPHFEKEPITPLSLLHKHLQCPEEIRPAGQKLT